MEGNGNTDVSSADSSDGSQCDAPQAVKVAVHIRPLIGAELFQGCKDCVSVVPGEPQVQIGSHSFTFDHVYGSTGSPATAIFEECVHPLVDGLFQGYNATVLAYGQTGSGKTYTMGTGYTVGGSTEGVIPKVMRVIFDKITALKDKAEFQIRVSFIEILKEEVHDLLDPNPPIAVKSDVPNAFGSKSAPGKLIQIRENTNGEITLAGVTETAVSSLDEMAACLEHGSLCRATGSTNMNTRSSRSHAIFTINLEQKRIIDNMTKAESTWDDTGDEFLCAKLHLVDLAGSERAKRTGADGVRFKEGVHINKGLLALGNVISALGDEKKRKEGGHVPYRDSKLTRLLQDSLGGNSRTVMIACISPADSNAEETLNTLKYANRARNIQNKPIVNRDPMAAEMQRMRHQVELLQAELMCIKEGGSFEEMQILKQRIAWLETSLLEVQQDLRIARDNLHLGAQRLLETQVERDRLQLKLDMMRNGKTWEEVKDDSEIEAAGLLQSYAERIKLLEEEIQHLRENSSFPSFAFGQQGYQDTTSSGLNAHNSVLSEGDGATELEDETIAKEIEHTRLRDSLDRELEDLNKKLEQKEAEMKNFQRGDGQILKQYFEKKIVELEEEKKILQSERDKYLNELTSLANASDGQSQKLQETYMQKVKSLEAQISELKKKQENQAQLLKQKQRTEEAAKRLQEEIQRIKSQKVQLQHKIKQESEQFRLWKQMKEKEVLQLKKEGRRNEYEMHKLQVLHQRQKMVLQRKTEEANAASRRLKDLLEARKPTTKETSLNGVAAVNGSSAQNEKNIQKWLDQELEFSVRIHEVRSSYETQADIRAGLAKELAQLKHEQENQTTQSNLTGGSSMSPGARRAKIVLLESMVNAASSALVAMASQLSEAEERERTCSGRARWQLVRSMGDAKSYLQAIFSLAVDARCKNWDKDLENKELREKISELEGLLRQSEAHRQERERQQVMKEQCIAKLLEGAMKDCTNDSLKSCLEEASNHLMRVDDARPRQLEYPDECTEKLATGNSHIEQQQIAEPDTIDLSSENDESDMDIDEIDDEDDEDDEIEDDGSDEDWCVGEKRLAKARSKKTKSQKSVIPDEPSVQGKTSELCCSCSKYSGCKTGKCACKAGGNYCGADCQCSSKKCANRAPGSQDYDDTEVVEAIETLELNRDIKFAQEGKAMESEKTGPVLKKEDIQRAEKVLAKHGAAVLDSVWTDELKGTLSAVPRSLHTNSNPSGDQKDAVRRPLVDIGNNVQAVDPDGQQKSKPRKRWGKALIQLVPATTPHNSLAQAGDHRDEAHQTENLVQPGSRNTEVPSAIDMIHSTTSNTENSAKFLPAASEADEIQQLYGVGPPKEFKPFRNLKKKSVLSPPSSPLRARNNHAVDEANHINRRLANAGTSGSPRAPGKAVCQEKENV